MGRSRRSGPDPRVVARQLGLTVAVNPDGKPSPAIWLYVVARQLGLTVAVNLSMNLRFVRLVAVGDIPKRSGDVCQTGGG